jgi:hypothetical protein
MGLAGFSVERYRSFLRSGDVPLRRLTLLYGYNSAGKSAVLRALPLLAASSQPGRATPLELGHESVRGASYSDLMCRFSAERTMNFDFRWDPSEHLAAARITLRNEPDATTPVRPLVEGWTFLDAQKRVAGRLRDVPGLEGAFEWELGANREIIKVINDGLVPTRVEGGQTAAVLVDDLARQLRSLSESVHWLGAVRSQPPRKLPLRDAPRRPDGAGDFAPLVLFHDADVRRDVDAWLRKMFGHGLALDAASGELGVNLTVRGGEERVSLADVGEGVAQVLPVLTLCAMSKHGRFPTGSIFAIEQPEMHLHPRAELHLAEILSEAASHGNGSRWLIETHSENLLLFLQLLVARCEIVPADLCLLWLSLDEGGATEVREIPMDPAGRPSGWPPGVFSEHVELARKLVLRRAGR